MMMRLVLLLLSLSAVAVADDRVSVAWWGAGWYVNPRKRVPNSNRTLKPKPEPNHSIRRTNNPNNSTVL